MLSWLQLEQIRALLDGLLDEATHRQLKLREALAEHHDEQNSVRISSNRPVEAYDEVFGEQVVAAAILNRLMHRSDVVTIRSNSDQLRKKRRSGLLRSPAGGSSPCDIGGLPPPTPAKEARGQSHKSRSIKKRQAT